VHILAPFTALIGCKKVSTWEPQLQQESFLRTEASMITTQADTMLTYPDQPHNKPFHIYTDTSDYQLGAGVVLM
jgi:hypothetical protein